MIGCITRLSAGGEKIRIRRPEFCLADLTDDRAFTPRIPLHHNGAGFQGGAIVFLGPEHIGHARRNEVIAWVLRIALQKRRIRPLGSLDLVCRPLFFRLLQQLRGCRA